METKRISELPSNDGALNGNELLEVATMPSTGTQTVASKKSLLSEIGKWIFGRLHNSRLLTQNKTIIGAINEIKNAETGEPGSGAAHNAVYRGKCLGPAPTAEQYEAIRNNTFDDMYVGDYWYDESEGIHWRIAGFNYYHGIGNGSPRAKITNYHVVIVPDEPLVEDTFVDEQGVLRETQINDSTTIAQTSAYNNAARGFKHPYTGVVVTEDPPGAGVAGTVSFTLTCKGKPSIRSITGWMYVSTIPSTSGGFLPETYCYVQYTGGNYSLNITQDSSNPDQWIVEFPCLYYDFTSRLGRLSNSYLRIIGIPQFPEYESKGFNYTESLPNFPKNTQLTVCYSYHEEGYGAIDKAEDIIVNKFGKNHLIPFPFGASGSGPFAAGNTVTVRLDLLSTEQITGNGSMSCIGENPQQYDERYFLSMGYTIEQMKTAFGSYNNAVLNDSRWVLNRLPLFVFNPSLIHTGYSYWLSSLYSYSGNNKFLPKTYNPFSTFLTRYIVMDEYGNQVVDTVIGKRPGTGIRPYFLLSYTSSPNNNS